MYTKLRILTLAVLWKLLVRSGWLEYFFFPLSNNSSDFD